MNCTGARRERLTLRRAALVVLVLVAVASFQRASAHAATWEPGALYAPMASQQQVAEEAEGQAELPWLFAVFAITWAAFFGYAFFVSRRQREMQREIEALRGALAERELQATQAGETPGRQG